MPRPAFFITRLGQSLSRLIDRLHPSTQTALTLSCYYHCILFLGLLITSMLIYQRPFGIRALEALRGWDGKHYLFIAEFGYPTAPQEDANVIAFFPLYPGMIALLSLTGLPYILSGFMLTFLGSIMGQVGLFELARTHFNTKVAWRSFWFLLITPIAMYFTTTYTEGFFLGLIVLFFVMLDKGHFVTAGLIGFAASLTRLPGITLIIPLFWEIIRHPYSRQKLRNYVGILLIPAGYVIYLAINWRLFDDPFYYQVVLMNNWHKTMTNPLSNIVRSVVYLVQGATRQIPIHTLNFLFDISWVLVFPLLSGIFLLCKGRFPLGWWGWMIANWLIITSQSYWLSSTRYVLILFPVYMMLGHLTNRFSWLFLPVTLLFSSLLLYGVRLFLMGQWVY